MTTFFPREISSVFVLTLTLVAFKNLIPLTVHPRACSYYFSSS